MRVCIGGTFYPFHNGHKTLIKKALKIAGKNGVIYIGITTGKLLFHKNDTKSYTYRKKTLEIFLSKLKFLGEIIIQPIYDEYGPTLIRDFDVIVVSPETEKTAKKINKKRKELSKSPLKIVKIPFVLAEDGIPISSSRIKKNEIDENGKKL